MNIYLDGSWLAEGIGATGLRRFSAEMTGAMLDLVAETDPSIARHVFSIGRPVEPAYRRPGVHYLRVPSGYRAFLWATAVSGRSTLARHLVPTPDALHLHDAVRFGGEMPGRCVVTLHDLAALRDPGTYPARAVWLRRRSLARLRASRVTVHAVSESTRADAIEIGGIAEDRVHVVPLGVRAKFFERVPAPVLAEARARWSLDRPFVLAVGAQHPRKNLSLLIGAFRDVLRTQGHDALLVLAGPGSLTHVDALCRREGYDARERSCVRVLGPVTDAELRICYQASACFAFPSLYEGFGLPVLEAMASGTPALVSDRSSLPEVAGDAGVLLDPTDREAWTQALVDVLQSSHRAELLAARGRRRAQRFTWESAARRVLSLMDPSLN